MKSEADFVTKLKRAIAVRLPEAVTTKHADRFTTDVPDLTICDLDQTLWIEAKFWKRKQTAKDVFRVGQTLACHRRALATGGRCWFAIAHEGGAIEVVAPYQVLALLNVKSDNLVTSLWPAGPIMAPTIRTVNELANLIALGLSGVITKTIR